MSPEIKFIFFQTAIILPFLTGYFLKRYIIDTHDLAKKVIRVNLLSIEPFIVLWSIWGLRLSFDHIFLPLSGFALVSAGFLIGMLTVRFTGRTRAGRKTYIISSSLANHGFTMGVYMCYLVAGEQGLGLAAIFTLYFLPYTFIFIFSYARTSSLKKIFSLKGLTENFLNLQNMPLHAVVFALLLHILGAKRPDLNIHIFFDALLLIAISLYYFSLGLNFSFGNFKSTGKEQVLLAGTKFLILPAVTFFILSMINVEAEVKTIIMIESFMPTAVYSVVTSILFDLDSKLASSLFVVNTLIFLVVILPIVYFNMKLFIF